MKQFAVYILSNKKNGTLYVGVTSNLVQRIWQHRVGEIRCFTNKYNVKKLMYYEIHDNAESAIKREKRLKKYKREQKIKLIVNDNPGWNDLYEVIVS